MEKTRKVQDDYIYDFVFDETEGYRISTFDKQDLAPAQDAGAVAI